MNMVELLFCDSDDTSLNEVASTVEKTGLANSVVAGDKRKCSLPSSEWSFLLCVTVASHVLAQLLKAISPIVLAYFKSRSGFSFEIKDGSRVIRVRSLADLDAAVRAAKSLESPAATKAKASKSPKDKRKSSR